MMKKILLLSILFSVFIAHGQTKSFHDFTAKTIDGQELSMSVFKGKKVLVVNTASKCGLTPQYQALQNIYAQYQAQGFEIIGFPANNFLRQEPGTNKEIKAFCTKNYGVTFQMMHKISVKGDDIHPIYQWLTTKAQNGVLDAKVKWNFQKFMIDEDGQLVDVAFPKEKPDSEKIINWIRSPKD